jgi:hypothetical protein
LQTFRKVILIAAIVLAMMQIIGAENIAATNIVLDANGNRVEHHRSSSVDVRFGSSADICAAQRHVRFTPNSDRESGHQQTVMSALPPKADVCANTNVCYGPIADMA